MTGKLLHVQKVPDSVQLFFVFSSRSSSSNLDTYILVTIGSYSAAFLRSANACALFPSWLKALHKDNKEASKRK